MTKKLCGTNYPLSICFIVVNEFCERFSYYGMKAVLTLYFMNYLHWDGNLSTAIYHAFGSLCYFTPILGAIIADSWLGKFKTIIYLSLVYVVGHVIKSVGAIPSVGNSTTHIALSMVGLILIALGTGGIKPCVAAFGGDQFSEEHLTERQKFFSIFYMSINAGSVLSTVITPMLRGDVQCFGGDCYALAFGVPAILMIIATVVFVSGSSLYKRNPPQGNIMGKVCKCIGFAIKNRWQNRSHLPARKHWLDWAEEKYSKRLIQEIKMVVRVLVLYIPLPMFWALFDQQGSRWTIQAGRMNMAFGSAFNIKPDQMQMLNALLILLFVPIFDLAVYPLVACCRIKITPLRKMSAGMVLAAMAFGAATLVEVNVVKTVVDPAPAQKCLLQVYNMAGGNATITFPDGQVNPFLSPIGNFEDPEYKTLSLNSANTTVNIEVTYNGQSSQCSPRFLEKSAYSLIVRSNPGIQCSAVEDNIEKDKNGLPFLRFFNTLTETINLTVGEVMFSVHAGEMSLNQTVDRGEYPDVSYTLQSGSSAHLNLDLLDFGAVYTVILTKEADTVVPHKMEDVKANNVHIGWQIPQYVLLTMGEVLFSITGLEFSYSQAPANMKSVLQAGWLLTVAFGNVIVLIVAEGAGLEQWIEFLLFACLLLGVCVIFSIMAHFYTYVIPEELDKIYLDDSEKEEEDDLKKTSNDIHLNKTGAGTRL